MHVVDGLMIPVRVNDECKVFEKVEFVTDNIKASPHLRQNSGFFSRGKILFQTVHHIRRIKRAQSKERVAARLVGVLPDDTPELHSFLEVDEEALHGMRTLTER